MSALEAALLKIGGVIATAAGKGLLRSRQAAAERRLPLVELAGARGLGLLPQRRLRRQIDQLAEIIAERLEPLSGTELRDLADHERLAALDGVARAFEAADLSDERVLRADVSSAAVEALIKHSAAQVLREIQLGEPGVKFFELVLHEACAYLTEIISTLPSFQNRVLRELLERDTEIIERQLPHAHQG
ncbi:hypothetical protein ACH347_28115 [Saccharopolyspora sp. 5N102]|uniref:NACHT N-terminal Helical domain 1-containing protein n=1 Tax=Saccharopolyspora sp. 5N102 TaxID=3375155 RepID=UPI0037903E35